MRRTARQLRSYRPSRKHDAEVLGRAQDAVSRLVNEKGEHGWRTSCGRSHTCRTNSSWSNFRPKKKQNKRRKKKGKVKNKSLASLVQTSPYIGVKKSSGRLKDGIDEVSYLHGPQARNVAVCLAGPSPPSTRASGQRFCGACCGTLKHQYTLTWVGSTGRFSFLDGMCDSCWDRITPMIRKYTTNYFEFSAIFRCLLCGLTLLLEVRCCAASL